MTTMTKTEYGWRPPYIGTHAWRHYDTEAEAQEAYDRVRTRLVTELVHNRTTYKVGDVVVLFGYSGYDSPVPFTVCSHIWAIDPGGDSNEDREGGMNPALILWDTVPHDYDTGPVVHAPSGKLQPYGLVDRIYPADSGYAHADIEVVHHVEQGPDIVVTTGSRELQFGGSWETHGINPESEFPFGFVCALTVMIDGAVFTLGDMAGPTPPEDLLERVREAMGMDEVEWEAWSDGGPGPS